MKKGDIVLGKDLKPGMAVVRVKHRLAKLVIEIDLEGDNKFYDGEPSIHFFDLNDAYYGPCSTSLFPEDEFEILYEHNTEEYIKMVDRVLNELTGNIKGIFEAIEDLDNLTKEYVK